MPEDVPRRSADEPSRRIRLSANGGMLGRRSRARARRDESEDTVALAPLKSGVAELSQAPVAGDPEAARKRLGTLWRSVWRPTRSHVLIAVVAFVMALAITLQIRASAVNDSFANVRRADLIALLDNATTETRRLEADIADLERTKADLQSGANTAQVARQEAEKRLETLRILAGTARAEGTGIRLTILDPAGKVTADMLVNAIAELRDSGAEVIEINDTIRVVGTTWFADGANGLVADGRAISRPIVFDVIGDPHSLEEGARFRGGLVSQVQAANIGGSVTITRPTTVVIDSLHQVKVNQYARPA